ncbi:MAG: phospholipase D family protein [Chloroflexota bacterium]|nr:phospholipase D family protein [Chloroflexota bacterium]MDE2920198.1 phospholipase D family protein [Chloroflexota bacterium]
MLAPDSRALLLDSLRPPAGYSLDRAVATTFTLDLETALTVPLAFAGFRLEEQPDPIEVMQSLRGMSERLDIFCQAGAIGASRWPSDLLALLEDVVHPVRRPRPGHIFHPKTWVLRFRDESEEPLYRLLVLSRNLTADRSWDTILWLDGWRARRINQRNAPLVRFVRALPGLTVSPLLPDRQTILGEFAEELRRVEWELPDGVHEAHFHPIGLPYARRFPVEEHFRGYRKLVISPFVREGAIRRIFRVRAGQTAVLISRGGELNALPADALDRVDVYELDPTASLAGDDADGESNQSFFTQLHAKVFVFERAKRAHLFVGSANATDAGLSQNVEFLCELVGRARTLGVDALVGEDAPLRAMLTPYDPCTEPPNGNGTDTRALDDLLLDIAGGVRFHTAIAKRTEGWVARITSDAAPRRIPDGACVTIAPYNRPDESYSFSKEDRVDFELPPRELADITAFLRLTASRKVNGETLERSTAVCSRLEGAPADRLRQILARQIDTPEKFLRLLALLIGFASGIGSVVSATGNGSASWSEGAGQGVLELLARALAESPESIDHLDEIIEHLRRSPHASNVLPQGWDDVWLPVLEARRAMRGGAA